MTVTQVLERLEALGAEKVRGRNRELGADHELDALVRSATVAQLADGLSAYVPEHRQRAVAIGEARGIYRAHPVSGGCTSPSAPLWVGEMVRRQGRAVNG